MVRRWWMITLSSFILIFLVVATLFFWMVGRGQAIYLLAQDALKQSR